MNKHQNLFSWTCFRWSATSRFLAKSQTPSNRFLSSSSNWEILLLYSVTSRDETRALRFLIFWPSLYILANFKSGYFNDYAWKLSPLTSLSPQSFQLGLQCVYLELNWWKDKVLKVLELYFLPNTGGPRIARFQSARSLI